MQDFRFVAKLQDIPTQKVAWAENIEVVFMEPGASLLPLSPTLPPQFLPVPSTRMYPKWIYKQQALGSTMPPASAPVRASGLAVGKARATAAQMAKITAKRIVANTQLVSLSEDWET